MKKLLFITWNISSGYGTENSLADVLNKFNEQEYDISIFPIFKSSNKSVFNDHIKILDAIVDHTKKDYNNKEAYEHYYKLLSSPLLFNKLIHESYDCVIACNHNAPSYFASYINCNSKILWIRGDMSELDYTKFNKNSNEYKQTKQEYEMQAKVLKCFDAIVVISNQVQKAVYELFKIEENVVKILNSVDREKIQLLSKEKINLPNKMLFTSVGRLDYNKNQILLLKAAKELKKYQNNFIIYLLGDGQNKDKLQKYIENNNLVSNVKILGYTSNPYPYMKNSIATVLTSLSEGFGLVLLESVILNTPIISTEVGIAKELVEKYNCGDIIDGKETEIAKVLFKYLTRYKEGKEAYNIGDEYGLMTEVKKTKLLIDSVIEKANNAKYKKLPYPEITIDFTQLDNLIIQKDYIYILRVIRKGVPYEYLINRKSNNDKLIIFNNGAIAGGNVNVPIFQRHSWAQLLKTSSVFCMDPTLYINRYLQVGWGVGKNDDYYLESSSLILKKLVDKMGIQLNNTVIFGSSAGGYISIIMGIYLKGATVVADNSQLDITKWIYKEAVDSMITFCFDNIDDTLKYRERFNVIDAFEKNNYVPKLYIHVNLCSNADNSTQLVPFLERFENIKKIVEFNGINVISRYEPGKGHYGLNQEEAIEFLYKVLGEA